MTTLHLISHTHWDREWYLTFQQFRLKLVHLMDGLLALLEADPEYKHFLLDGQTIVLDDYLHIRPEQFSLICKHVQSGRLLIGPWHILPDEFLVSPEATLRNLLQGERTAHQLGRKMKVGYIPDPFGHIGQLPQILQGFGIDSACLQRGLSVEPCEFWWQAPDGSRVFMAYLREGYGNAANLPTSDPDLFVQAVCQLRDSLLPHSFSGHLLLMHGTDHMEPCPDTSRLIDYANSRLGDDRLIHSTLPKYLQTVGRQLSAAGDQLLTDDRSAATGLDYQPRPQSGASAGRLNEPPPPGISPGEHRDQQSSLPTIVGELRSSQRHQLLPGVLSTRMWIKQRNHACETLLEKWAEPFSAWAEMVTGDHQQNAASLPHPTSRIIQPEHILRQAWRLLMECHPHDSICGCSIDQVHDEMRPRFDQVEQIAEEITLQSLVALAGQVDTQARVEPAQTAVLVFNPTAGPRTDLVTVESELPPGEAVFAVVDAAGKPAPYQLGSLESRELINFSLGREEFKSSLGMIQEGRIAGMVLREIGFHRQGSQVAIDLVLADSGEPDLQAWEFARRELEAYLADGTIGEFTVRARSAPATSLMLVARDLPGYGYQTYWIRSKPAAAPAPVRPARIGRFRRFLLPLVGKLAQLPFVARYLKPPAHAGADVFTTKPPFVIENEFFTVAASPVNGSLTVQDKRTGITYQGMNKFIDGGDCGDEYNYCPPPHDRQVSAARVRRVSVGRGNLKQSLEVKLELAIPWELTPDRQRRRSETVILPVTTRVTLVAGVPRIDILTEVDNQARDHRLRVHFPIRFCPTHGDHDGHYEIVRRPVGIPDFDETWKEQPRPEAPQRAFTSVSDGKIGLTIANRGLPEIEVLANQDGVPGEGELALTLLRCVGWLSRDDYATRRGHAGPGLPTPGAQLPGKWSFEYAIIPHSGDWQHSFFQAYAFNAPLRAIITSLHAGTLPASTSLVRVAAQTVNNNRQYASTSTTAPLFQLSALKAAEDGRGWIVRGYNLGAEPLKVTLAPWKPFSGVARVNLAEEVQARLDPEPDGSVTFQVRGHEIATIKFIPVVEKTFTET